jgi:hypothetical protein
MTSALETLPQAAARLAELAGEARFHSAPVLAHKLAACARAARRAQKAGHEGPINDGGDPHTPAQGLFMAREGLAVDVRRYEVIAPGSPLTVLARAGLAAVSEVCA